MSDEHRERYDQIWQRVHRVILDVVHSVLGPPPPDVVQKIDDAIREAKQDWEKGEGRCRDDDETL